MTVRIIVVDNDDSIREFFALRLNRADWEVLTYDYAHIDLAVLTESPPDLVILDFNIRDGSLGWEFLQIIKMQDTTARIPILITTSAFHLSADIRAYLLARYIRVVHKLFDLDNLLPLVEETLRMANQSDVLFSSDRTLPILLVEDTEDLRNTLATILRLEGYEVVTADNGQLALEALHNADYCLILLDIAMPIMDGFEFLANYARQLRPHSPVVIMSGQEDPRARIFPSFVIDILPKPFEISQLLPVVKRYAQPV